MWPFSWGNNYNRAIEPTKSFSLAVGGVHPGRDELVIYDEMDHERDLSDHQLDCLTNSDVLQIEARPDFDSYAAGDGVLLVAVAPGNATVTCLIDGVDLPDAYKVTIAPQRLIQILIAEAGTQINDESSFKDGVVTLESSSPTGNAIGAVIRNRINLIEANEMPNLFNVDYDTFNANPSASYYDSVISAPGQFAPTNPSDPQNKIFSDAQDRNFLDGDWRDAYDQAVLTAAGIYNAEIVDPTGGAFAFFSPTEEQWSIIGQAQINSAPELPEGCGVSNESFPAFAPLQIVIVEGIWTYEDKRPAFVFIRHRTENQPAVTSL